MVEILWHRRGNQAANGENKPQPVISGETGLLDSNFTTKREFMKLWIIEPLINFMSKIG